MNDDTRLVDTNILVQAYTVSDEKKHQIALSLVERVWEGEGLVASNLRPPRGRRWFLSSPSPSDSLSPLRSEGEQRFDRFVNLIATNK